MTSPTSSSLTIAQLAALTGATIPVGADTDYQITHLANLTDAGPEGVGFLSNPKLTSQLSATRAGAVLIKSADLMHCPPSTIALVVKDPYLAFARLSQHWAKAMPSGVHPQAYVAPSATVADSASIGPFAYVGEHAVIGERTVLHPRATVLDETQIGADCILHSGCVIGADGFGFARDGQAWVKIAQLGCVVIGNDVEIGANTTIDRGALQNTVIADGVKLDNQIQIAHNVMIGEHTAIAACVGIAGSTIIGKRCTIGGAAGVIGHLTIADDVHISAFSLVQSSIKQAGHYTGVYPLEEHGAWEKNAATLRQLNKLRGRVKQLEQTLSIEDLKQS